MGFRNCDERTEADWARVSEVEELNLHPRPVLERIGKMNGSEECNRLLDIENAQKGTVAIVKGNMLVLLSRHLRIKVKPWLWWRMRVEDGVLEAQPRKSRCLARSKRKVEYLKEVLATHWARLL